MRTKYFLLVSIMLTAFVFSVSEVNAQTRYRGSRHTSSHGGHYSGGHGRSHKGGSYRHSSTANHYGRHKR